MRDITVTTIMRMAYKKETKSVQDLVGILCSGHKVQSKVLVPAVKRVLRMKPGEVLHCKQS